MAIPRVYLSSESIVGASEIMILAPIALRENSITFDLPNPRLDANDESMVFNGVDL